MPPIPRSLARTTIKRAASAGKCLRCGHFFTAAEPVPRDPEPVPLGRVLPHARFNESEAAERTAAIAAHQHELSARLERNVGLSVAALDYLLNISGDLVAPTIVEHEILEVL